MACVPSAMEEAPNKNGWTPCVFSPCTVLGWVPGLKFCSCGSMFGIMAAGLAEAAKSDMLSPTLSPAPPTWGMLFSAAAGGGRAMPSSCMLLLGCPNEGGVCWLMYWPLTAAPPGGSPGGGPGIRVALGCHWSCIWLALGEARAKERCTCGWGAAAGPRGSFDFSGLGLAARTGGFWRRMLASAARRSRNEGMSLARPPPSCPVECSCFERASLSANFFGQEPHK
mmetsp:Transcript_66817/g.118550  ORF Transcript_66817/g.118550 Transcript_66817/m.118550 type:complete len:225 (-) Transcript_66817:558-1232(-)